MAENFRNCSRRALDANVFISVFGILLISVFPVAQITLGAVNIHKCPAAPAIPVYLIVCGILALLIMGLFAAPRLLCPAAQSSRGWMLAVFILLLFVLIWFLYGSYQIYSVHPPSYTKFDLNISNGTGSTPTASLEVQERLLNRSRTPILNEDPHRNSSNQTLKNRNQTLSFSITEMKVEHDHLQTAPYCDKTTYLFAFWTTTLVYVFAAHALLLFICIYGFMKIGHLITVYFAT